MVNSSLRRELTEKMESQFGSGRHNNLKDAAAALVVINYIYVSFVVVMRNILYMCHDRGHQLIRLTTYKSCVSSTSARCAREIKVIANVKYARCHLEINLRRTQTNIFCVTTKNSVLFLAV